MKVEDKLRLLKSYITTPSVSIRTLVEVNEKVVNSSIRIDIHPLCHDGEQYLEGTNEWDYNLFIFSEQGKDIEEAINNVFHYMVEGCLFGRVHLKEVDTDTKIKELARYLDYRLRHLIVDLERKIGYSLQF